MRRARRQNESGFALLLVFAMAAAVAAMLYLEMPRVAFEHQRNKEGLLAERGEQYIRAIQLFYKKTNRYPQKIEDLESTNNIRFLRRRYKDPMTGDEEWRLIHVDSGGQYVDSLIHKRTDEKQESGPSALSSNIIGIGASAEYVPQAGEKTGAAAIRRASDRIIPGVPGSVPAAGQGTTETATDGAQPRSEASPATRAGAQAAQLPGAIQGVNPLTGAQTGQPVGATPATSAQQGSGVGSGGGFGMGGGFGNSSSSSSGSGTSTATQGQGNGQASGSFGQSGFAGGFNGGNRGTQGTSNQAVQAIQNMLTNPRPGGNQGGFGSFGGGNQSGNQSSGSGFGGFGAGNQGGNQGGNNLGGNGTAGGSANGGPTQGGIVGVASKRDMEGIRLYNERSNYKEWEFLYDRKKALESEGMANGRPGQQAQQGTGQNGVQGQGQNQSSNPFSFGSGGGQQQTRPAPGSSSGGFGGTGFGRGN